VRALGVEPIGYNAEVGRVGREYQSGCVERTQSVSTEGEVVLAPGAHISFLTLYIGRVCWKP
jgi:hypothetical protein